MNTTYYLCDKFGRYACPIGFVSSPDNASDFDTFESAQAAARHYSDALGTECRVVCHAAPSLKLTLIDTKGDTLHSVECFVNADGWLEDVTRSPTFDVECEIALGNYNEGGIASGAVTDYNENPECYWVID